MFGLSMEKLVIVAIIVALIAGPHRLPLYADKLSSGMRSFRDVVERTRLAAEETTGVALDGETWKRLDPRQYDPRRIVREALTSTEPTPLEVSLSVRARGGAAATEQSTAADHCGADASQEHLSTCDDPHAEIRTEILQLSGSAPATTTTADQSDSSDAEVAPRQQPGAPVRGPGRWVRAGTSAHPRRVWVVDEVDPSSFPASAEPNPTDPAGESAATRDLVPAGLS